MESEKPLQRAQNEFRLAWRERVPREPVPGSQAAPRSPTGGIRRVWVYGSRWCVNRGRRAWCFKPCPSAMEVRASESGLVAGKPRPESLK